MRAEPAHWNKYINDSDIPTPYNFGPPPDTIRDMIIEKMRFTGRYSWQRAMQAGISKEAMHEVIRTLQAEGWDIQTRVYTNGHSYRLKYDPILDRRYAR